MYTFLVECPACGTRFPVARPAGGEGEFRQCLGTASDGRIHLECICCPYAVEVDAYGNSREAPHWGKSNAESRTEKPAGDPRQSTVPRPLAPLDTLRRLRRDGEK